MQFKSEDLELKDLACESKLSEAQTMLNKFEQRNARLAEVVKSAEKQKPSD